MEFSTLIFIFFFFPIFLLCYFLCKKRKNRNLILLAFSLFFYGWGEPIYILLMILSIITNYFLAIQIDKNKPKLFLTLALIFNIGLLVVFKYTDFLISSTNFIFRTSLPLSKIALPIGISFYTFQILSYVIDVYFKKVKVQKNVLNLGCYITAFPQLIAGPIVKYQTIEQELTDRHETIEDFAYGTRRFVGGLAKKVLIANSVGFIADTILSQAPGSYGFIGAWLGVMAYTLQIYFDFSGYSDMAIGMGRMLGFHFDENFNFPYIAKSITDFWRRWHISLSSFFRDYVYIPLGGNRVKLKRFCFNILVVWTLTGLWHGASFNFMLWGFYYGVLLLIEKLVLKSKMEQWPNYVKHIYTIVLVMIGWAIFRSTNINDFISLFKAMCGFYGFGNLEIFQAVQLLQVKYIFLFIMGILFSVPFYKNWKFKKTVFNYFIFDVILILLFLICVMFMVTGSYNPFIYFRF